VTSVSHKGIEIFGNAHYIRHTIFFLKYFHFFQCLLDFTNLLPWRIVHVNQILETTFFISLKCLEIHQIVLYKLFNDLWKMTTYIQCPRNTDQEITSWRNFKLMKSICPTPKSNPDVTLKAILNINVNNVIDCSRITLLHSIMNIYCDVPSFWHFHLEHPIIHHGVGCNHNQMNEWWQRIQPQLGLFFNVWTFS